MGGHTGTFVNASFQGRAGCEIGCGKRLGTTASDREQHFYQRLADLRTGKPHIDAFRKHISEVHGVCTKDDARYFIMDNALAAFQPGTATTLDFKLGRRTAFVGDSSRTKAARHAKFIDKVTISDRANFRLEGATRRQFLVDSATVRKNSLCGRKTRKVFARLNNPKFKLQMMHPYFVFDDFFRKAPPTMAQTLLSDLRALNKSFTRPNLAAACRGELALAFIGSSILLIRGVRGGKPVATFQLIDFGHPFVLTQDWGLKRSHFMQYVENYTNGLLAVEHVLKAWMKWSTKPRPPSEAYPSLRHVLSDFKSVSAPSCA